MKRENDLGRDDVGALVWRTALPSMLAQFVSVLYSIVDRMYIGHIAGAGETALAGVGVCGPVVTMVGSAAVWISWGASPLMGIRMGEGRPEEAKRILRTGFVMLLAFSLAMMALVIPLREPMLRFFGASDATYPYADAYFTTYLMGTVFALLATGLNQMIIAQGFAAQAMRLVVLGAALNIALDPVFIFALNMGVRGAALATVLSQLASAAGAMLFLWQAGGGEAGTRRPEHGGGEKNTGAGIHALCHHRHRQCDGDCDERGFAALRRRTDGRQAGHLRGHRSEFHAGDDHAAGRHFRRHAVDSFL